MRLELDLRRYRASQGFAMRDRTLHNRPEHKGGERRGASDQRQRSAMQNEQRLQTHLDLSAFQRLQRLLGTKKKARLLMLGIVQSLSAIDRRPYLLQEPRARMNSRFTKGCRTAQDR